MNDAPCLNVINQDGIYKGLRQFRKYKSIRLF